MLFRSISWPAVSGATGYTVLVSSSSEVSEGDPVTILEETFSTDSTTLSGWTLSGTEYYTGADYVHGRTGRALKYNADSDYALTPTFSGGTKVTFSHLGNSGGTFVVSGLVSRVVGGTPTETWVKIGEEATTSGTWKTKSFDLPTGTKQLGFYYKKSSNSSLDDVIITAPDVGGTVVHRAELGADETSTTATQLEMPHQYWFWVTATGAESCEQTGWGTAWTENASLIEVSPTHYNFGTVNKGESKTATFTVRNDGNIPLTFTSVDAVPGGQGFTVATTDAGGLTGNIGASGGTRTYVVTFAPGSSGAKAAALQFLCNAANAAAVDGQSYKKVEIPLTGSCYDPATADPEVLEISVTDGVGVANTVWDESLAKDEAEEVPVLTVTAYHYNGMDAGSARWSLYGPDGTAVLENRTFSGMAAVSYDGRSCSRYTAAIPALGAASTRLGSYTVGVTLKDATREITLTTTNCTPPETGVLIISYRSCTFLNLAPSLIDLTPKQPLTCQYCYPPFRSRGFLLWDGESFGMPSRCSTSMVQPLLWAGSGPLRLQNPAVPTPLEVPTACLRLMCVPNK